MTVHGPYVIVSEAIGLPWEEGSIFERQGNQISVSIASPALHNRIFTIHHISGDYYHIYNHHRSDILVSTGSDQVSTFKSNDHSVRQQDNSYWRIKHKGNSATGRAIYTIKNKATGRPLGEMTGRKELWRVDDFKDAIRQDYPQIQEIDRPAPQVVYPQPVNTQTSNLCGNPTCGKDHICPLDYNRIVQPMGYPGVPV